MYLYKFKNEEKDINFQYDECEFLAHAFQRSMGFDMVLFMDFNNTTDYANKEYLTASYKEHQEMNQEYEVKQDKTGILHAFNAFEGNGKTLYMDSFGITDDINDILQNFPKGYNKPTYSIEFGTDEINSIPKEECCILLTVHAEDNANEEKSHWSTFNKYHEEGINSFKYSLIKMKPANEFVYNHHDEILPYIKQKQYGIDDLYVSRIPQINDIVQFQEGNCEFLACALNEEFGYKAHVILEFDNESNMDNASYLHKDYKGIVKEYRKGTIDDCCCNISHVFCSFEKDGQIYYVDSTGITEDINDILKNFNYTEDDLTIVNDFYDDNELNKLEGGSLLITMEDPHDIQNYHWSTKWDDYGNHYNGKELKGKAFEEYTENERMQPAREFVDEYKECLCIETETKSKHKTIER